ncbi:MAG: hypothetical protein ACE5HB_09065, partial [Terriglobia bacterium]
LEVDRHLVHVRLEQPTLEGLSQAVDRTRQTIWAVLRGEGDEFDEQRASSMLTAKRVQRATQLLQALNEELDAGNVHGRTEGLDELSAWLGLVYKKLTYLFSGRPLPPTATE